MPLPVGDELGSAYPRVWGKGCTSLPRSHQGDLPQVRADEPGVTDNVEKVHRACARASLQTGQPIMGHSRPVSNARRGRSRFSSRAQEARGAVKPSIIVACWHMLTTGEVYRDLGGDYFQRCDSREGHQAPHRPARTPRTHRRLTGGRLNPNGNFLSGSAPSRAWCNGCTRAFQALRDGFDSRRPL